MIDDGIRSGAFLAPDSVVAAAYILTALNGLVAWYRPGGRLSAGAIADIYAELSLRAVQTARSAA